MCSPCMSINDFAMCYFVMRTTLCNIGHKLYFIVSNIYLSTLQFTQTVIIARLHAYLYSKVQFAA